MNKYLSFSIALVIPWLIFFSGIYYFRFSQELIFGLPSLFFWLFLSMVITSICLSISWEIDKKDYKDEGA